MKLGDRLKYFRLQEKLTQKNMALRLGIAVSTYQNYERNEREAGESFYLKMMNSFGVNPLWLLSGKGAVFLDRYCLEKDALKSLGSRLRQLRERRGLSVAEAAAQLGAGEEEYARYEAGEAEPPRRELELYASGLDASMAWLLDGAGEPGEPGDPTLETARQAIERSAAARRAAALMGSLPAARQEEILQLVRDRALLEKLRRQNEKEEDPDEGIL